MMIQKINFHAIGRASDRSSRQKPSDASCGDKRKEPSSDVTRDFEDNERASAVRQRVDHMDSSHTGKERLLKECIILQYQQQELLLQRAEAIRQGKGNSKAEAALIQDFIHLETERLFLRDHWAKQIGSSTSFVPSPQTLLSSMDEVRAKLAVELCHKQAKRISELIPKTPLPAKTAPAIDRSAETSSSKPDEPTAVVAPGTFNKESSKDTKFCLADEYLRVRPDRATRQEKSSNGTLDTPLQESTKDTLSLADRIRLQTVKPKPKSYYRHASHCNSRLRQMNMPITSKQYPRTTAMIVEEPEHSATVACNGIRIQEGTTAPIHLLGIAAPADSPATAHSNVATIACSPPGVRRRGIDP